MPKLIKSPSNFYCSNDTFFGGNDDWSYWTYCRDTLQDDFQYYRFRKIFYYHFNKVKLDNITRFIRDVQVQARIPVKDRCRVLKTTSDNTICIKLTGFWMSKIRFSLLTALIRAGLNYSKSIDTAICSKYFRGNSGVAVRRFLDGNYCIRYIPWKTDIFDGWRDYFNYDIIDRDKIAKIVVSKSQARKIVNV